MRAEFFVTDADYIVRDGKPCVRLFGRTADGKSAIALDSSFMPYFYVVLREGASPEDVENLKSKIESLHIEGPAEGVSDETENGGGDAVPVGGEISPKKVETVERIIGQKGQNVLKVFAHLPAHIPHLKSAVREIRHGGMIDSVREYDIPFYKRYLFDRQITPLGFVSAEGREVLEDYKKRLGYDAEIVFDASSILPEKKLASAGDVKVLSFDLETIEEDKRLSIIMASIAAGEYAKVISYEKNGTAHEIHVASEKELLSRLRDIVVMQDPDFITTYNGDAFDFLVIDSRAKDLKEKMVFGRDGAPVKFQKKGRIKAAMTKGRPHIDLYNFVERVMSPAMSSETLSLDSVAQELLGEGKHGLSWDQMKEYWNKKHKLDELAEYCMQDSKLTLKLARRILPNIFALSEITSQVPADTSRMTYGQLVEHYMIKKAGEMGIIVPNRPSSGEISERKEMEQYAGGFVKEPKAGLYENIAVFDFRGLYPSIIVSHNIDPSTLECECCRGRAENRVPDRNYWFCTKNKGFIPHVLEDLINERKNLKSQMKTAEKKSAAYAELDVRQYAVKTVSNAMYGYLGFAGSRWYNRKCAEAVTAFGRNYIRGVIASAEKMGIEVLYGDSVTRDRFITIMNKHGIVEIKNIEELFLENIKNVVLFGNKERIPLERYKALTLNPITRNAEWSRINEIIRHKTNKKTFRVNQKYGESIVTEDHSFITARGGRLEETTPLDMNGKNMVAVKNIPPLKKIKSINFFDILSQYSMKVSYKNREKISNIRDSGGWLSFGWTNRKKPIKLRRTLRIDSPKFGALCRLIGAYISEGSASTTETTSTRFGASIASSDVVWLEQLKKDYLSIFKNAKACIIRSTKKRRTLYYKNGSAGKTVEYEDKTCKLQMMNGLSAVFFKMICGQKSYGKKIPDFMYHVPEKYQRIMLEHMIKGDGSRIFMNRRLNYSEDYKKKNFRYETRSLQLMSGLSFLLTLFNQNYTIRYRPGKRTYILTTTSKNNSNLFTKITEKENADYVYDLSVEGTHMFVDSCGQILLHNTDSLFLHIEKDTEKIAKDFLAKINATLPGIMELDLQGVYVRGLFVSKKVGEGGAKKRYALIDSSGNVTIRGFEKVRRDWSRLSKDTQEKVLELVLNNKKDEAVRYVKKIVADIKAEKVDIKDLRIYSQLTRQIKHYQQIGPHVAAAEKAIARGRYIRTGETIEFIVTKGKGSISERSELFEFAKNYDPEYYINNQIVPAALRVLHIFGVTEDDLLGKAKQKGLAGWGK